MRLKDKIVVITGAGSGMGAAMTKLFAQEGAQVVGADINEESVEKLISTLGDASHRVNALKVDVSDRAQVEGMINHAMEKYGRLDVLVNNAGILDNMVTVDELEDELWYKVLEVNLSSVMFSCRKAVKVMTGQQGGGCIINLASVGGLNGCRAGVSYTASKFGVVGITKNIGFMYAQKGIRCNAICPGSIETNIGVGLRTPSEFGLERAMGGVHLSPRNGKAEEVARVALFLASDDASFVNGTTITVDGGWTSY